MNTIHQVISSTSFLCKDSGLVKKKKKEKRKKKRKKKKKEIFS
jgi:hypothetical protein